MGYRGTVEEVAICCTVARRGRGGSPWRSVVACGNIDPPERGTVVPYSADESGPVDTVVWV